MKRKSKILLFILSFVCLACLLCGCEVSNQQIAEQVPETDTSMYVVIEVTTVDDNNRIYTYYHKETKIMYMFWAGYRNGGLTMLVDENGNPLTWKGSIK